MPKAIAFDDLHSSASDTTPSRARRLLMRAITYSPKDTIAALLALGAITTIMVNATMFQAGKHPSPMFTTPAAFQTVVAPSPLPRPRPAEAGATLPEVRATETRTIEVKPAEMKLAVSAPPRTIAPPVAVPAPAPRATPASVRSDPVGDLIASSRKVASVQRALTEYGYGQLKPTGVVGSDTQAAIQRFERERKLPISGQMSDRLLRELAVVIGRPVE